MELTGDSKILSDAERHVLSLLPYERGSLIRAFKTAKSGATVLILDLISPDPTRSKPHVLKIQDKIRGAAEQEKHSTAEGSRIGSFVPKLIDYRDDPTTDLAVTVYEVAGKSVLQIRPLASYIDQNDLTVSSLIIERCASFFAAFVPLSEYWNNRRTESAHTFCVNVVQRGKDRLYGPNSLSARIDALVPELSNRTCLSFDDVPLALPNPVAFIYQGDLWKDECAIFPEGWAHGDLHSDNILWHDTSGKLMIIDWASMEEHAPLFLDTALLEIDIIHRSLDCLTAKSWQEWNIASAFLSGSFWTSESDLPSGALSMGVWRLIGPLRHYWQTQFDHVGLSIELREVFGVAYFLTLYSCTLVLLRNQHIPTDRKIGLLLLAARYLEAALRALRVEIPCRNTLRIPAAHELAAKFATGDTKRAVEVRYLTKLIEEWKESSAIYTTLAGEAQTSPRHVGSNMNPFYELLAQRQEELASPRALRSYEISDIAQELITRRRVALLGDPGAGKTFTLWEVGRRLAEEALRSEAAPIPVIVPLGGYTAGQTINEYICSCSANQLRSLNGHVAELIANQRVAFLLDGMNEVGGVEREAAGLALAQFVKDNPNSILVITCRQADFPSGFPLERICIRPLDPLRVLSFLENLLGKEQGERLFWELVDKDGQAQRHYWPRFQKGGGTMRDFLLERVQPSGLAEPWYSWDWEFWLKLRDNSRSYLSLAKNPYMLSMVATTYDQRGSLPANRGALFKLFVDGLMAREKERVSDSAWISSEDQFAALGSLAFAIQRDQRGTNVERSYAVRMLGKPGMLDLACREHVLEGNSGRVTFSHQLLQEFFAAYALNSERLVKGLKAEAIWPKSEWWKPVGFEESSVLLAGIYHSNPRSVLEWLRDANPELAARCIVDGGIEVSSDFRQLMLAAWLPRLTDVREPVLARAAIGRALGLVRGDIRPGVCYVDELSGLPRFEWVRVPGEEFLFGSGESAQMRTVEEFRISKYLVTNAQFQPFVNEGYSADWKHCWTERGWKNKDEKLGPTDYSETLVLPNHPRIGIDWYEAMAFCNWLDFRMHELGLLSDEVQVRLPTELEWEKMARSTDGRKWPWGEQFNAELCNVVEIESTTAVGIYPNGASPYGVHDVVGNAWKWCLTLWEPDVTKPPCNDPDAPGERVYRGGSWGSNLWGREAWTPDILNCSVRHHIIPEDDRPDAIGFHVVSGPRIYT